MSGIFPRTLYIAWKASTPKLLYTVLTMRRRSPSGQLSSKIPSSVSGIMKELSLQKPRERNGWRCLKIMKPSKPSYCLG